MRSVVADSGRDINVFHFRCRQVISLVKRSLVVLDGGAGSSRQAARALAPFPQVRCMRQALAFEEITPRIVSGEFATPLAAYEAVRSLVVMPTTRKIDSAGAAQQPR
jgi:hypothetical protein